ncbi:hypothetical protein TRSC58_07489 [Trypanosoma rangeli SC58]|uniref:Uncharacterized protein n=1 Tax=Trypanosoma rangeli SC58 TaxID=429131 RepID=A0A061IV70_TRYRA|nr:hypothetical protein TRSC58_07489 [Trypanosoma rangeli SC58]
MQAHPGEVQRGPGRRRRGTVTQRKGTPSLSPLLLPSQKGRRLMNTTLRPFIWAPKFKKKESVSAGYIYIKGFWFVVKRKGKGVEGKRQRTHQVFN